MIKYYYNPEDKMVVISDGRTFTIDKCRTHTRDFGRVRFRNEELEFKRRKLVELENYQLKSLMKLRKEVEKYE